jgi:nucleoside 2-deoxyribosyltransferase
MRFRDCNCSPFRGVSLDAGTAYEIGYACALGKPVFGYSNVLAS